MIDAELEAFLTGGLSDVEAALRAAAAAEIMPRHRQLAAHEVVEKTGPFDLVTVADRGAELHLASALLALLPGSVVVGEEAVHADPGSYDALHGDAPVWVVDPIDGTRQFVRGESGFCTLLALVRRGVVLASWTYAPVRDEMAVAVRGRGARLNGVPLARGAVGEPVRVATSHPDYTTPEQKRALLRLSVEGVAARPCGSAGLEYLAVARGESDAVAFDWELAWDHAAGLLLVEETGGAHLTLAGAPFRLTGGNALPFVAAANPELAARLRDLLAGP
ncbi:inositol monophosphatase family protein [Streptomyces sp. NPDC060194]|uniref:inositol monophosphatase family protein n=1 Tax=Streptomyces sp. NPDC060194 TaxID=3347069 RepID=UPI003646D01C